MEAKIKGKTGKVEQYFKIYQAQKAALQTTTPKAPTPNAAGKHKQKRDQSPEVNLDGSGRDPESPIRKTKEESNDKLVVGDLKFMSGALPRHNKMGFTPYFDKNIHKQRGPIPLIIFNKSWKNTAILYHLEKQAKLKDSVGDRNRYTGFPYPSKWTQMFAKWTTNHQGFHKAPVNEYGYKKFAKWLLAHKTNANAILAEDGFMAALRYNIQIRTNCFAHRVTLEDGTKSIADILVLRPKVASSTYATCRKFKELEFLDNPYAELGPRASWDPTTRTPWGGQKTQPKQPGPNASTSALTSCNQDKSKARPPSQAATRDQIMIQINSHKKPKEMGQTATGAGNNGRWYLH
jgi:hypothetical protein